MRGLLNKAPNCEVSSLSFSKIVGFGVYILSILLPFGRNLCFYFGSGDLVPPQDCFEEAR